MAIRARAERLVAIVDAETLRMLIDLASSFAQAREYLEEQGLVHIEDQIVVGGQRRTASPSECADFRRKERQAISRGTAALREALGSAP